MRGMPWPAAVAVSGGSDSVALMHLLRDWAECRGVDPPIVLCVDHRLRPESRQECRQVVRWAGALGLKAFVLRGALIAAGSDLEARARRLRYRLLGVRGKRNKLAAIFVAHTQDDLAETFLLRLGRGSGLDGLAPLGPLSRFPDPAFSDLFVARPLLGFQRTELRAYLEQCGHGWIDDPMNADVRFARARVRAILPALREAGVPADRIAAAALHLRRAREALNVMCDAVLERASLPTPEGVLLDPHALTAAPREVGLRALATVLMGVAGAEYRPRFERLEALFDAMGAGTIGAGRTLHGCKIGRAPKRLAQFGPGTLFVRPEETRTVPRGKRRQGPRVS